MPDQSFDPLAYIENAFLDREPDTADVGPGLKEFIHGTSGPKTKYRRLGMKAPRPRRRAAPLPEIVDGKLEEAWRVLPKSLRFLATHYDDATAEKAYKDGFRESRQDLIRRLLDPELTLEEVSRLLGVSPATVRRYTNRGWLNHHRTSGNQRRFRLSDIVSFVERHGRVPQE